jgi:hypothetical protein
MHSGPMDMVMAQLSKFTTHGELLHKIAELFAVIDADHSGECTFEEAKVPSCLRALARCCARVTVLARARVVRHAVGVLRVVEVTGWHGCILW